MLKEGLVILLTILIVACEGPTGSDGKDGGYDKQIRLTFPFAFLSTNSIQWQLPNTYTYLTKFNKTFYVDVDSIIFVVPISSARDTSYAELYNITDSVPIIGSQLSTVSSSYQLCETGNIYNNLPSDEITLSIRLRVSNSTGYCYVSTPQLILYRK